MSDFAGPCLAAGELSMDTRRPSGNGRAAPLLSPRSPGPWTMTSADGKTRIVMKFGGTSVADVERIKAVAARVKREVDAGHEVAVVVSAMAGATNQLAGWTNAIARLHDAREYDVVVASGEQVTSGLTALALQELGVAARSWLGWQVPILTDGAHG